MRPERPAATIAALRSAQAAAITAARRQKRIAVALWSHGLVPEGREQIARALRMIVDAWTPPSSGTAGASAAEPEAPVAHAALAELTRASYSNVKRLAAALTAGPYSAEETTFHEVRYECERLLRFTARCLLTPVQLRRRRLIAGAAVAGALVALWVGVRLWMGPDVTASTVYGSDYPAAHVIDGDEATEWLLRDKQPGSVDITFPFGRAVRAVQIVNAHNHAFVDRAAHDVKVTAFSRHGVLATATGSFARLTAERSVLTLPLVAEGVKRLRVEVLSFFGSGGGLAEVQVQ